MKEITEATKLRDICIEQMPSYQDSKGKEKKLKQRALLDSCNETLEYLMDNFPHPSDMTPEKFDEVRKEVWNGLLMIEGEPVNLSYEAYPIYIMRSLLKDSKVPLVQCEKWKEFAEVFTTLVMPKPETE